MKINKISVLLLLGLISSSVGGSVHAEDLGVMDAAVVDGGGVRVSLNDAKGRVWRLEQSADLFGWVSVGLESSSRGPVEFLEHGEERSFFRAVVEMAPPATLAFSQICVPVSEAESEVVVRVVRRGALGSILRARYLTAAVTATPGIDYEDAMGLIEFAADQRELLVSFSILGDDSGEIDEGFLVSLVSDEGDDAAPIDEILVSILDDDGTAQSLAVCQEFLPPSIGFSPRPFGLEEGDGDLFWSGAGEGPIQRWSVGTGLYGPVTQKMEFLERMEVRDGYIYRLEARDGGSASGCVGQGSHRALVRTGLDGTAPLHLLEFDNCASGVANLVVDPHFAFVMASVESPVRYELLRVPVDGGAPVSLMQTPHAVGAMASDGEYLYWSEEAWDDEAGFQHDFYRVSRHGGDLEELGGQFAELTGNIVIDQGRILLAESTFSTVRLLSLATTTGETEVLWQGPTGSTDGGIQQVSVQEASIYWMDGNSVNRIPRRGGTREVLVSGLQGPASFWVVGGLLYWTDGAQEGAVYSRALDGAGSIDRLAGATYPSQLRPFEGRLYWIEAGPFARVNGFGRIATVPLEGGASTTAVAGVSGDIPPIVIHGESCYIADRWTVRRMPRDGGNAEVLAVGSFAIASIACDGEFVYWVEGGGLSTLRRVPVTGGVSQLLGRGGGGTPGSLLVHGEDLYWVDGETRLVKMPKSGGSPEVLAEHGGGISDLLIEGTDLYFALRGAVVLNRLPLEGGAVESLGSSLISSWSRLRAEGGYIYRLRQTGVDRIDFDAGTTEVLFEGALGQDPFFAGGLAVRDGVVWWTEPETGRVRSLR